MNKTNFADQLKKLFLRQINKSVQKTELIETVVNHAVGALMISSTV